MYVDLSVKLDTKGMDSFMAAEKTVNTSEHSFIRGGHFGTHLDTRDKEFPLQKIITRGRVFDISRLNVTEVKPSDLDISAIQPDDFVMFYSGILKKCGYATKEYVSTYTELSDELIDALISKKISFIGVDMVGAKAPKDHVRIDQYCADNGIFIIENLDNLDVLCENTKGSPFTVYTFPLNLVGFSGLPCRVIAQI